MHRCMMSPRMSRVGIGKVGFFVILIAKLHTKRNVSLCAPHMQYNVRTSDDSSSSSSNGGTFSNSPASFGTHCTCSSSFPTSQGIAIAVLVYCSTADATSALNKSVALIPVGSDRSSDGERSKIELCAARCVQGAGGGGGTEDTGGAGAFVPFCGWNAHAAPPSMYKSRSDVGALIVRDNTRVTAAGARSLPGTPGRVATGKLRPGTAECNPLLAVNITV